MRRRIHGYLDMGRLGWAQPNCRVFEDRATGTLYMLSHDSTPSVDLVNPVPRQCNARPEEPIVETSIGRVRFYVEDGIFQWEKVEGGATAADPWTVNFSEKKVVYRVGLAVETGGGTPLLVTEDGEELEVTEAGVTLDVSEGGETEVIDLERLDLAQIP